MCLNCGCGIADDPMGNDDNLTLTDLAKAAIAAGQDAETTLNNTRQALQNITVEGLQKRIDELKDHQS